MRPVSALVSNHLVLVSSLVMIACSASGQVDEFSIYRVVLDEAISFHLNQSIFEGRTTLLVTSKLNWHDPDHRGPPRWSYDGQHPDHLLSDLINAGVIDSTCSMGEGPAGGCQESPERLIVSVTGLNTSQEGKHRCEVLVRAPYDRAVPGIGERVRMSYYVLIEYVVEGQGESTRIVEKNVILIA